MAGYVAEMVEDLLGVEVFQCVFWCTMNKNIL